MKIRHYEFNPSEVLKPYVDCYWYQAFDSGLNMETPLQRCVPLGMTEIIFHLDKQKCVVLVNGEWKELPDAFVVGVYKDAVIWKSHTACKVFGIRLRPEALLHLFGIPAATLVNNYSDLNTFFGRDIGRFTESILGETMLSNLIAAAEHFLLSQQKTSLRINSYFEQGARRIRASQGNITIEDLSAELCISERQLQRQFKDNIGMGSKAYLRIIRFRHAYEYLQNNPGSISWTDVSYNFGYADQAHFIKDFKQYTGAVPTAMVLHNEQYPQMTGSTN